MTNAAQLHAHAAADVARARANYLMGGGSWSIPCFVPTTDHKPQPRWYQVKIS